MAVFDDFEEVALEFEGDTFAEIVDINHRNTFLFTGTSGCKRAGLYHRGCRRRKDEDR
jgi:predicted nucleic-acid-binding Zn-ribbon protein